LAFANLLFIIGAAAQDGNDPFNCRVRTNDLTYDLTPLQGERTVSRTRETPPSSWVDSVRFDLCADLKLQDGVAASDQCHGGTRACLTKTNRKGENSDRVVAVIPLAQSSALDPKYSHIAPANDNPKGLSLTLHGGEYTSVAQSLTVTLYCSTTESEPQFTSYENGEVKLMWSTPAGCGMAADEDTKPPPDQTPDPEEVGSGIGWFFLVLLLTFMSYLALGAYYNYSTYGATGFDLIPHRDFWRDVPYMIRDVLDHLCTSFRPRHSSRRGYIAV
ncbi:autophagy-related protein 27, partial [Thelephora terrestris]